MKLDTANGRMELNIGRVELGAGLAFQTPKEGYEVACLYHLNMGFQKDLLFYLNQIGSLHN